MIMASLFVLLMSFSLPPVLAFRTKTDVIGNITYTVTSPSDSVEWKIRPPVTLDKVTFVFRSISIGTAQMLIYESGRPTPVFSCVACGSTLPPMFTSTTGSVTIAIQGVGGASFTKSSFNLQYFGHIAADQSVTSDSTNFLAELKMGYGHIKPPLQGGALLLANSKLQWKITVKASMIRFAFVHLNFQAGCGATLSIYDGPTETSNIIYQGCSNGTFPKYWLFSSSGTALIVLQGGTRSVAVDFQVDYLADDDLFHCGSLVTSPDRLDANSMSIVDGSKTSNSMRRSESCKWLIQPINRGPVMLLMHWVSLKQGTKVVVYDSDGPDGVVLWNSEGTFAIVPPPLVSSGDSLFVTYSSNTLLAGSFLGFRGDYFSCHMGSYGIGSTQELYAMSSAMGITLPDRVTPALYPNNHNYIRHESNFSYTFLVKPMSAVGDLMIIFSQLNILDCGDRLRVFDGESSFDPLLGEFCGDKLPYLWLRASSGKAFIEFTSDTDLDRNSTFELSYYADGPNYHCGFPTNPATLKSPSMRFTDGSHSAEALYSNQHCEWVISPSGSESVFLYFDRLDVEGGGDVIVYDGIDAGAPVLLHVREGFAVPVPVLSTARAVRVKYTTSSDVGIGYGFSLAYFSVGSIFSGPGDGIINLFSSTYNSLRLPTSGVTGNRIASNYTWHIHPISEMNSLYIALSKVSIANCEETFRLFSGSVPVRAENLLAEFGCNGEVIIFDTNQSVRTGSSWFELSGGEAVIQFVSIAMRPYSTPLSTNSFFDLSYYSTGESYQCGLATLPGKLTASSMIFSDGSLPGEPMHPGERCEWIICNEYAVVPGGKLVLEFSENDLRGGAEMWVYDGMNESADVLWHCRDCIELPHRLISSTSTLFVRFISPPTRPKDDFDIEIGTGFQVSYWSIDEEFWRDSSDPQLLLSPKGFEFSPVVEFMENSTSSWRLGLSLESSTLSFFPSYTFQVDDFQVPHSDGRSPWAIRKFSPPEDSVQTCGFVTGYTSSHLVSPSVSVSSHQRSTSYITTWDVVKMVLNIAGSSDSKAYEPADISAVSDPIIPSKTCQYTFDSGPTRQSISLKINSFKGESSGRLRVVAGIFGHDRVILDVNRNSIRKHKLNIPCGKATIIIDANTTTNMTTSLVDYGFEMTYSLNSDSGQDCIKYIKSLKEKKKENKLYANLFIPVAVLFVVGVCVTSVLFVQNRLPKCLFFKRVKKRLFNRKKYSGPAPRPYPKFTPKLDEFKNKMLFRGECIVCQVSQQKVLSLKCGHKICLDDLRGYIVAALGDVSMFPLKCPLHFDNCTGKVEAEAAKRVLTEQQYDKFLEFSDRALYGEGMRCIFCTNFVNYPTNASVAMVECPYCIQRFCMRCKKPWHYGQRCSVDTYDDSLEAWTKNTGAQKCPTCNKIIEKEDANTCHHMVHKLTDGIPCSRDRTDFCYLCGMEVSQDYPHDEVKNPGINHFPEGVFQRCRTQMIRERELDREKLRRAKRMKKQNTLRSRSNVSTVAPILDDDWDNGSIESARSLPAFGSDPFDLAFGQTLNPRSAHISYLYNEDDDDF